MLCEDQRISDSTYAERAPPDDGNPHNGCKDCATREGIVNQKKNYDEAFHDKQSMIRGLWGPEEPYTLCREDEASLLDNMYYGWVRRIIFLASKEKLTPESLPPPTEDVRAHECGLRLSRSIQGAMYQRNAWSLFAGAAVLSKRDRSSRGVLRWVGVPQQGGYTKMMAAVEWSTPPAEHVLQRSMAPGQSPYFNGVVHGERLFTPAETNACTLEEADSIELQLVSPTSELGHAIMTPKRLSMTRRLFTALPHYFWWQFPLKALGDICTLCLPLLLAMFVNYLSSGTATWGYGIFLVLALFIVQAIQSCSLHRFYYTSIKGGLQYRSALDAVIFEKCFTISNKSLARPDINAGRIINMLGGDVERVNDFMQYCMYLWSSPCVFFVSIALLAKFVGWSSLMAILAMALTLPINAMIMKKSVSARQKLVRATDVRVKATNEFLSGIRIAKFMTWEPRFVANIEAKRALEIVYLKEVQTCRIVMSFISGATPMIMIAVVFVLYRLLGHALTPAVVFPTIALLGIIRMPFIMIPFVFTAAAQFFVSISRINTFLECEDTASSSVEDIEAYIKNHVQRSVAYRVAAAFEGTDITAFVPERLPPALKAPQSLVARVLRRFGCGLCQAHAHRMSPTAVEAEEDGGTTAARASPTSPGAAKPPPPVTTDPQLKQTEAVYQLEPKVLLQNLNVQIPAGKLTLVLGATGSGKSTLLQALLSQFEVSRGRVWAERRIAYVPQQPWIMNATLRNNILFFSEEKEEELKTAIRVSQLEADLALLSSGLETEIGEKGVNLSGGQKARVSLARAVYADRDLYLLDDPLSALDAHVGARVMDDCVLKQLSGKTRVLATHHLYVLPEADFVIVLDEQKITFAGMQSDFVQSDAYRTMMENVSSEGGAVSKNEPDTSNANHEAHETSSAGGDSTTEKCSLDKTAAKPSAEPTTENGTAAHLMTAEEKASGGVPWTTYVEYFRFCGGVAVAVLTLLTFALTEVLTVSSTLWLSIWATHRISGLSDASYLLWYVVLVILGTVSTPLRFFTAFNGMRRGCVNLHRAMLRSVSRATMAFFDTTPLGRLINRFSRDIDVADNGLQMSMIQLLNCLFSITFSLLITTISQPVVLVAILPCAYLYYRLLLFYSAANREIRRTSSIAKSPLFSLLGEVLSGLSTIKAYGRASVMMAEALKRLDLVYSCSLLENAANRWLGVRVELLSNLIVTCISFFGVIGVMTHFGAQDIGLISLSLTMAIQTTGQLNWLVRQAATVEADMNSVERVVHYTHNIDHEDMPELEEELNKLEQQQQRHKEKGSLKSSLASTNVVIEGGQPEPAARHDVQAGSLEFQHVQMRYREGLPLVLNDVSFRIAPREKVGIVGRTGSGKSTMLLTFMRMVDICGGEIVVNGAPIRSYALRELRRQFSMIPQDPVLFDGTVRMNVDPFTEASEAEVWHALELVGMRGRIASESEGLEAAVLEGGSNFSVGQRQLLCMARALLKRGSGFILMDEATANVDHSLDRQIQRTVMHAFTEYTVITIAHRLQTVAQYDKVIVMDRGVVAELGSPAALVKDRSSLFRTMVDAQGKEEARRFIAMADKASVS